jgi:hypothetical protein
MRLIAIQAQIAAILLFGCLSGTRPSQAAEQVAFPSEAQPQPSAFTPCATLALKESFDNNVYLQRVTSNAFQHSFITSVLPSVGFAYKPTGAFNATLSYAPEIHFFHSDSEEDFTLHRVLLGVGGTTGNTRWDVNENLVAINGSDLGPSFFGPGGAPATGAPQIRDRRDAIIERGQLKVTQTLESWFVRPVLSGYYHDFQTLQLTNPGYQNYVDRGDWNAGAELGRALTEKCWLTLGYRYGQQTQAKLFDFPEQYDCSYQRALFGLEGKPWPWLALSVCAGPEFRRYADSVPQSFGTRNVVYPYVDSTATVSVTKANSLTLSVKNFQQPGFSGRSAYVDSTYEATWRHNLSGKLTVGLGLRAYNTDFLNPVIRNDWIITPNAVMSYNFNRHFSGEISYLFDDAFSLVPNTPGREYTRQLVAAGLKYGF